MNEPLTASQSTPSTAFVNHLDLEPHAGAGSLIVVAVALASLVGAGISRLVRTRRRRGRIREVNERVRRVTPPVVTVLGYAWEIHESQTVMGTISGLNTCTSSKGTSPYPCFDATCPVTLSAGVSVSRICSALPWDPDVARPEGPPASDRVRIAFLPGDRARCNVGARLTGSLLELVVLTLIPGAIGGAALVAWGRPGASGLWYDREPLNTEELQ